AARGVDVFSEGQMADGSAINVVTGDLAQHLIVWKGHLATDMGESAMRGDEGQPLAILAQHAQHADVDPVLEVLLTQIFGNRPILADRADIEFLAGAEGQLALR